MRNMKKTAAPQEISSVEELQKFHAPLLAWLKKQTGYREDATTSSPIKIISGTKFHNYFFEVKNICIKREFVKKSCHTEQRHNSTGKDLDRSCLWSVRSDFLDIDNLKKTDHLKEFDIRLTETSTISDCEKCKAKGKVTCSECRGDKTVTCSKCDGDGTVEKKVMIDCPKCKGKGTYYNKTCPECAGGLTFVGNMISGKDGKMGNRTPGRGYIEVWRNETCIYCDGTGRVTCRKCYGQGEITCPDCRGVGHVEHIWAIRQGIFTPDEEVRVYKDTGFSNLLPIIPHDKIKEKKTIVIWGSKTSKIKDKLSDSVQCDFLNDLEKDLNKITDSLECPGQKIVTQVASLQQVANYTRVEFEHLTQRYVAWIDSQNPKFIYEFSGEGFCAAWQRSKNKFMKNLNIFQRLFQKRIDFLEVIPDILQENEKEQLNQQLTKIHQKTRTYNEAEYVPLEVSNSSNNQESPQQPQGNKSRNAYAILAIFLPGVHNLYAGYIVKGIIQLLIAICSLGIGLAFTWPWALFEASFVKKDAKKNLMRQGRCIWIARILFALVIFFVAKEIIEDEFTANKKPGSNATTEQTIKTESEKDKQGTVSTPVATEKTSGSMGKDFEDNLLK